MTCALTPIKRRMPQLVPAAVTQKVGKYPMSTSSIPAAPTRRGDPDTSYEAAETINVNRMQAETVKALAELHEPVEEWRLQERVEQRLGCRLGDSTIRTRLKELVGKGVVVVADRKGVSRAGHRCARYALAEMGVAAWASATTTVPKPLTML